MLKAVMHKATFKHDNGDLIINCLLDSGALHASYIRKSFVEEHMDSFRKYISPYNGRATLADKITVIDINNILRIPLSLTSASGHIYHIDVKLMVMENLGEEVIIGLPVIVRSLLPLFVEALKLAAENILFHDESNDIYQIIENPWSVMDELAIEDEETPLPCSFTGPLHFLMMSRQEALDQYFGYFDTHIDPKMKESTPIVELLRTLGSEVFVPVKWEGVLGMEPIEFKWKENMPDRIMPRPRTVNPKLMENAKLEMERLLTYFYIPSTSPVASCLVIAPKATAPFIRFCGDYATLVNHYIESGHYPIPHVFHTLERISKYKIFFDLDMTNSFHQFPLAEKTRRMLSLQTPWGQFEPLFLPEGVPPSSGILQKFVSEVFSDFSEWLIGIFDNILILANDYQEGYDKVKMVLERCKERRIVLKMAKSWFGFNSCEFFGYKCSHQTYCLTDKRKDSIMQIPMPTNTKGMQSFLGCANFFTKFVPNYGTFAAKLHEMTYKTFSWDKSTWKHDYVKCFEDFKKALLDSVTLFYPDYELPWILRVDASDDGVGYVLMQLRGEVLCPVVFGSKKFSAQAYNWDTFNKEAFALYYGVKDCEYYLRPVHFQLEGDHRNLAWMEASLVPKVIRWRVYLQGFSFSFNHIPGTANRVADWQSRLFMLDRADERDNSADTFTSHYLELNGLSASKKNVRSKIDAERESAALPSENAEKIDAQSPPTETVSLTRKQMLDKVHGGRSAHLGARRTWMLLNEHFPGHGISYSQVSEHISNCIICQKTRLGMNEVIVPIIRHLKNDAPRRVVGIDHLSLEPDRYGMTGAYVARDHFSKLVFIYPVKEQSAINAATTLFLYSVYFGCFDYLMSDPGTEFTSQVVRELNAWFGIHHRVSLTDRHESNGVEGANKDFLRHIRAFLSEFRMKDRWSEPNVIAWCMFMMNKFNDSESGIAPYTLTFGSDAVRHFDFPKESADKAITAKFLKTLDEDLAVAKNMATELQQKLVEKRTKFNEAQNMFQEGDFVLHRIPEDKPLMSKLVGRYSGPYVVLVQRKNDVSCRHCATGQVKEFFVGDLKLFVGTEEDALKMAMLDADQFVVDKFLAYKGDPMSRMSMEFQVKFVDGSIVWLPWSEDLFSTIPYEDYVRSIPELFPLLYRLKEARAMISDINKSPIPDIESGDKFYVDIRFYGVDWYEALNLPDMHNKTYVAEHIYGRINANRLKVDVSCHILNRKFVANALFVYQYGKRVNPRDGDVLITSQHIEEYPQLLSKKVATRSVADYQYLLGKRYTDDEDHREYEVVKIDTMRDRSIVAYVKWVRQPYSRSKLMDDPIHVADVVRMLQESQHLKTSEAMKKTEVGGR